MNQECGKSPGLSSPGKRITKFSYSLAILPLVCAVSLVTASRAATVLDPDPEVSTTEFGHTVVTIGDVNNDGVPDLAVGAPFQDGDFVSIATGYGLPQNVGKVYVVDGANFTILNELTDPEFDVIQAQHFGGQLGSSLAVVSDLNGDGVSEVIAGVPHHIDNPGTLDQAINAGEAFVFSGQTGAVLLTLHDPSGEEDGKFGTAVAGLGDVNNDGKADLIVGVPGKDIGGEEGIPNVGEAYVFSGSTGQLIRTLDHPSLGGAEAGAAFGSAVANAGDVNHDGISDILVGSPGDGHVFVFSGQTGALLFDIASPTTDALPSFGAAVDGGKDFNRDGIPDFVIGAPLQKGLSGGAYIYNGSNGTLQRRLKAAAPQGYARFGASVLASDDITGDGRPDVVVGAPDQTVNGLPHAGEAFVINGRNGKPFQSLTSVAPQTGARYGSALTSVDFNGNGRATVVVGVPDESISTGDGIAHVQMGQIEIQ